MEMLLWAASTFGLLGLISGGISLWLQHRDGSFHELRSQVRQLDLDVHEQFDVIEKWTRRDRVRRLREGREAAGIVADAPVSIADRKALLRAKAGLAEGKQA